MSSLVIISCLFATGALAAGPRCTWQSNDYTLNDVTWWGGISFNYNCWNNDFSCGSLKWEGSFTREWTDWQGADQSRDYTYSTSYKRCLYDDVCRVFAGGENECEYASYEYEVWRPRSCDSANDFDAFTETHDVNLYFSCCNSTQGTAIESPVACNEEIEFSAETCSVSDPFSTYLDTLNTCWNDVKYTFMEDLLCDTERGDILTYSDNCTNADASWNRPSRAVNDTNVTECSYRPTCAPELRELLTNFSGCACGAAINNGYSGNFIGAAMEINWARFCPGVEIECAADGISNLIYKYLYVRYRFRIALARTAFTTAVKARIRRRIAQRLNARNDEETIMVEEDTTRRRRNLLQDTTDVVVKIPVFDTDTQALMVAAITGAVDDLADEFGVTVDNEAQDTEDVEEITNGEYEIEPTTTSVIVTESAANKYITAIIPCILIISAVM